MLSSKTSPYSYINDIVKFFGFFWGGVFFFSKISSLFSSIYYHHNFQLFYMNHNKVISQHISESIVIVDDFVFEKYLLNID